jgi:Carboxypeptidase regulatory-like domain
VTYSESRHCLRPLSLLILFLGTLPCFAQYSGNIQGVVSDPAGAAINGAAVLLRNLDTGVTATTTTTDSGNYRFSSLPPGNYRVAAEANGFRKAEANFALNTSGTKGINLAPPVASAQQSITVEVHPPVVDTDDSRLQATLSADTVRDLPSANRNLWDILPSRPAWSVSARGWREKPRVVFRTTSGRRLPKSVPMVVATPATWSWLMV